MPFLSLPSPTSRGIKGWAWWLTPVIPEGDGGRRIAFKASLGYIVRLYLKKKQKGGLGTCLKW
jgi:hypothetical protein